MVVKSIPGEPNVVDLPDPLGPGSGEVVVKVMASGICYRDLLVVEGHFPRARAPLILGHEFAGVVEEVGDGVEWPSKGTRIASLPFASCGRCYRCVSSQENMCRVRAFYGEELPGSFAEKVIAKIRSLVELPTEVSFEAGAIAGCVVGTILTAFRTVGTNIGPYVLVTGAGGGVGIHAIQVGKALGYSVIAVTHSEWKVPAIYGAGADHVITESQFANEVRKITGGGVDLIIDTVGERTFEQSLKSLSWGGKLVLLGNVTVGTVSLQLGQIILRGVKIAGIANSTRRDLLDALDLIRRGKVRPVISSVVTPEKVGDALVALRESRPIGRQVLKFQ